MPVRCLRAAALWVAVMPVAFLGAACNSTAEQGSTFSSASSSGAATQGDDGQLEGGAGGPVEPTATAPPNKDQSGGAGGPPEPAPTTVDVNALCKAAAVSRTNLPDGWPDPSTQDALNNMATRLAADFKSLGYPELSAAFADYATAGVALLTSYQSSDTATVASARERLIASGRSASEMARSLGFDECAALTLNG